mgnify:CR=1 FL=1
MKPIGLLILVFSFSRVVQAQQLLTKNQQEVQNTVTNFFETLSNRDSVELKNYCTAEVLFIEYGQVWNLDTLIRKAIRLNTASDFKRLNTLDFITSHVEKHTAWLTYNLHSEILRYGKKTKIHRLETIVVVKETDRWKISVLHSTRIR